ncbi:hypothetical protein LSH36_171g03013 [Paralvinella palmiformis]|uniref:TM2 domain-containing protein n=1 Tax=Paralvinella palmiformis TaxID=53620 RepID=A0AAD9JSZ7_9ANNE|nr:hypothetical protein LSH36_171g03013 [Paralvinella palmiformis]
MNVCLLFTCICLVGLQFIALFTFSVIIPVPDSEDQCFNETCGVDFNPRSPLIKCQYVPDEFVVCELPPPDLNGNRTAKEERGYGCLKASTALNTNKIYTGHYFVTTLIYSVLLGILGMDRFCLGHTGTAVGKLLTLGGFGVWWIVDIIQLVIGSLRPADDSNWMPYY